MMLNNYFAEVGYLSINHDKEQLCGDHIQVIRPDSKTTVLVLADGLGSGVKASILSTLTSKMIATMIANNISMIECVKAIAETLPVCNERNIAYSTFSIIKITENKFVEIYNYDNPMPFYIHNGKVVNLNMTCETIDNKRIYHTKIVASCDDTFILLSDGVVHAGIGQILNFGWDLPQIHAYVEAVYDSKTSAKSLATTLIDYVNKLYDGKPGDDSTCAIIKIRQRNPVTLMMGPPSTKEDDEKMLSLFFGKEGKHIVCGGTTSHIVAEYLKKPLLYDLDYLDRNIPPTAKIEGVDLVTEGVITMNKVLENVKNYYGDNSSYFDWCYLPDGASQITRLLLEEATDINFFVGCAINAAHQQEGLALAFSTKMQIIDEMTKTLRLLDKNIKISYF